MTLLPKVAPAGPMTTRAQMIEENKSTRLRCDLFACTQPAPYDVFENMSPDLNSIGSLG